MPIIVTPYIPTYITVHLGTPDSDAENLTISFREYIKNVASSEVYPTWHNSALRANILAQVSFALNRVYTEFYPSLSISQRPQLTIKSSSKEETSLTASAP